MNLRILGDNSKVSQKELKYAVQYMYEFLVPKDVYKETKVSLINVNMPVRYCGSTTRTKGTTNTFRIKINRRLNKKQQLLTIGHELVHVRQYMLNELVELVGDGAIAVYKEEFIDMNSIKYNRLPWEIEANSKMYGLYKLWTMYKKEKGLKF